MVQASTLVIAAFAIAPVLGAPSVAPRPAATKIPQVVSPTPEVAEPVNARDLMTDSSELELNARDPFNFGNVFRKIGSVANKVHRVARIFLRDEQGSLVELDMRDLDFDTLVERDLDLDELDARAPFNFGSVFRRIKRVAHRVGGTALKVAPLFLRDEDGSLVDVEMRELFDKELEAREPEPEPKFRINFGRIGRAALGAAKLFIRDEEGNVYYVREAEPTIEGALEAREPKLRIGRILRTAQSVGRKAIGVAGRVSRMASAFGLRELELEDDLDAREMTFADFDEIDARDLVDLDEVLELAARDPAFNLKRFLTKARTTGSRILRTADTVSRKAHALGLRSIDELD